MKQQVGVPAAICPRQAVEDQRQDRLGLIHLAEGVGAAGQFAEGLPQGRKQKRRGGGVNRRVAADLGEEAIRVGEKTGVRGPGGEIEVAEDFLGDLFPVGSQFEAFHECSAPQTHC